MTASKALLMAAVLLSVPVVPALAHDDDDRGYTSHERFHDQLSEAHERATSTAFTVALNTVLSSCPSGPS